MAAPQVSKTPQTSAYYATQAGLLVAVARALSALWPSLDPGNLAGTFPRIRLGAAGVGAQYSTAGASLAADYYEELRDSHQIKPAFRVLGIDTSTTEQVEAYIDKAAAELLDSIDSLVDEVYLAEVYAQIQREVEGAAQKVVADAGRDQLFDAIRQDKEARGWARVTRPGACSFCRMLATRGAVYTKETVTFRAHVPVNGKGGTCQCTAEPQFAAGYEPTAQARADIGVWNQIADEGFKGPDAANEFRRRIEGRADGPRRPRGDARKRAATPSEARRQQPGFDALTTSQLDHQLSVLDGIPASEYRTKQMARIRARLAELAKQTSR